MRLTRIDFFRHRLPLCASRSDTDACWQLPIEEQIEQLDHKTLPANTDRTAEIVDKVLWLVVMSSN